MDKLYVLLSLLHDWATEFQRIFMEHSCVLEAIIPRMYQQGMLGFRGAQGSSGADVPREDPLHCCPLIGGECCRDSFQHPAVAITFH